MSPVPSHAVQFHGFRLWLPSWASRPCRARAVEAQDLTVRVGHFRT